MYKLFCILVYGYVPTWTDIKTGNITEYEGTKIGFYHVQKCDQTGKVRMIRMFS